MARTRPKPERIETADRVEVLGVGVDPLRVEELGDRVLQLVRQEKTGAGPSLVLNVNAHSLNLARREKGLRRILDSAEVVFADGAGVVLAAKMAGGYLPERITYADWAWTLAQLAEREGLSLYLLGGRPGVAERASTKLLEKYPNLEIAGTQHGYFDPTHSGRENQKIVEEINAVRPDLLLVGLGMPLQEQWLLDNLYDLEARVALNCGAAFDYVSGELERGPRVLTDNGFEWLARLAIEPGRLWRRYLIGNPLFLARATNAAIKKRLGGEGPGLRKEPRP
ncbi:MAG: WecB/TagA/CpsF family glycosyltransferase [Rubrobacter sp.]